MFRHSALQIRWVSCAWRETSRFSFGAGEARYFAVECRFEVPPNARFEGTWYSGTLMLDFSTTEGPLRREVPFFVSARELNDELRYIGSGGRPPGTKR